MHSLKKIIQLAFFLNPKKKEAKELKIKNIKPLPKFKQGLTELKLNQLKKL